MGTKAYVKAFRRIALNVMARHGDDHTKNLLFVLGNRRTRVLAPAIASVKVWF
jgi:serine/threonine protein kinase HipA of HipAB toxin-antitoxin module